jgi:ABC-type transport system involved in multi-copper enzyme maturation permease subunit
MTDNPANPVPNGVRAIAALFALCAIYLGITGGLMLARPGTVAMSAGAPLMFGLQLAGPYMFLLMAAVGTGVAWGLVELNNIARHAASLIAIAGIVMLVPSVSAATVMVQPKALTFGGLGIIVRVIVAWYLSRAEVADQFRRSV